MNWIRIAVKIKNDPRIGALAAACRIRVEHAVGLVTCALTEFPDHARDGDVSTVPDVVLEQWALWGGKVGVFAAAFRAHLCDGAGVVRAWERHNGAAIREADLARDRAKRWREERKTNDERTAYEHRTERRTNGEANALRTHLRDGTGRDVTNNTDLQASPDPEVSGGAPRRRVARQKPPGVAKYPHFGEPYRGQVIDAWKRLGAVDASRLVRAVGPCFRPPDDPGYVPPQFVVMGVVDYCGLVDKGKSAPFASPEDCAKRLLTLARNCERLDAVDPVARVDANFVAIHGHRMPGAGGA